MSKSSNSGRGSRQSGFRNRWVKRTLAITSFVLSASAANADIAASVTLALGASGTIDPGEQTSLEIILSNSNPSASVTNLAFSNVLPGTLPNGLFVDATATYECTDPATSITSAGSGTLTATPGTQAISLSGGVIPARAAGSDGFCVIAIPVSAGTSNGSFRTYTYAIADGAVTGTDGAPVANSGAVSQSINVNALQRPRITQHGVSNGNRLILGGDPQTLTMTVTNNDNVDIENFSLTDTFPLIGGSPAFEVAASPNAGASCSSGPNPTFTGGANSGDTSVTLNGTLPANGTCTFTVDISALTTDNLFSTLVTNSVDAQADWSNDLGIELEADSDRVITLQSPLLVDVDFDNEELANGQADIMTVTWVNLANSPLTINSFVNDPIDGIGNAGFGLKLTGNPSMSCTSGTPGTLSATAGNIGYDLDAPMTLAAGATCRITVPFVGTVQIQGTTSTYTNALDDGDFTVGNLGGASIVAQQSSDSILVGDEIRISITSSPGSVAPGQPIRYVVQIENFGAAPVNNLTLTDVLPSGVSLLTGAINGNDYTPTLTGAGCSGLTDTNTIGATTAVFGMGTLPGRTNVNQPSSCFITYYAQAPAGSGNTSNDIPAGALTWNGGASSNPTGTGATSTSNTSPFTALKSFNPTNASEGVVSRLTITLTNQTVNEITNMALTDAFPSDGVTGGQLIVASLPNASTTCGAGVVTANAGDSSFSLSGGVVPGRANLGTGAAGTCRVQVDVIGPAGTYNNQVTVTGDATNADGSGPVAVSDGSNTATLTYSSALTVAKQFEPSVVSSGGTSNVIIRVANGGSAQLTGVEITDALPAGLTVSAGTTPYTTCGGSPDIVVNGGSTQIDLSNATVPAGGTCDLVFDVDAIGSGPWVNDIPIGSVRADGGVINVNPASATLSELAPQSLFISKSINPSSLRFPGQSARLNVSITNGSASTTGLGLVDYFTADGTNTTNFNGMVIDNAPMPSTTCPAGTVIAPVDGRFVALSGANLAPSASCTFSVNVTSLAVGGITNTIPVGQATSTQGTTNINPTSSSLTTNANLGVVKSFAPGVIEPGQRSRLTIRVFNSKATPVSDISLVDDMPAGVTIPAGANPQTTCGGTFTLTSTQVRLDSGALAGATGSSPATCSVSVDVTASVSSAYENVIPTDAVMGIAGGLSISNADPADADLLVSAPLEVQVAIDNSTLDTAIQTGAPFSTGSATSMRGTSEVLTIRLRNPGPTSVTGLRLQDRLPTGLVLSTVPGAATTCSGGTISAPVSGTAVTLTGATLAAGASCEVTVNVLSNVPGTYVDDIPAGAVTTNEGTTNAESTRAGLIVLDPPSVGLAFEGPAIEPGGTSTSVITLGNGNDGPLTLTSPFSYTLPNAPGPINIEAVPNATSTCGGAVSATPGSVAITLPSGSTIPAGGCEIRVDVTGATPGDYTGLIPAGDLQTNAGPNPDAATAPLVISTAGYISGRVFGDNDVTQDGTFTTGTDTPIAGVTINLHSGPGCGGAPVQTGVTDTVGNYLFSGLAAGTYSVCQPGQPADTFNGTTTAGGIVTFGGSVGSPGTASNPSPSSSQIIGIVLGESAGNIAGSPDNLFAELPESALSGTVFRDDDNNGIQNGSEPGFAGQTIELLQSGSVVRTTTTDGSGNYSFGDLQPGTYDIRQPAQPADTVNGSTIPGVVPNGGTTGTATTPTVSPSQITDIILPPNTSVAANNFAELPTTRRLTGRIFVDFDNSGTFDGNDYGLSGQTVNLTGADINGNPVTRSVVTDANGQYTFDGLPEGTYTITQPDQPSDTSNGQTTAGSAGGTATGTGTTPSSISGVNLTGANTVGGDYYFAEVPGPAVDLTVAITHAPTSFAENNDDGTFIVTPSNIGPVDSSGVVTVSTTLPAGIAPTGATGAGWTCTVAGQTVTCTSNDVIPSSGSGNPITIATIVADGLAGQLLAAFASVSGVSEPASFTSNNTDDDTVAIASGADVSGSIWRDLDHDRVRDGGEPAVQGWTVELVQSGTVIGTASTDASGQYSIADVPPGTGFSLRFREPSTGAIFGAAVPNEDGAAFVNGIVDPTTNPAGADASDGTLRNLTLTAGDDFVGQSLPLDPAGVVYDAITRAPVSAATVSISGPAGFTAAHVVGGSTSMATGAEGLYQFLLLPTAPAGTYALSITNPGSYVGPVSDLIAPCTATLSVGAAPDPALVQNQAGAPATSVTAHDAASCPAMSAGLAAGGNSTQYYLSFTLTPGTSADVINNHIPLDPILTDSLVVTKTTPREEVYRGTGVPYTITARSSLSSTLNNVTLRDIVPPGFVYRAGTASIDGVLVEPTGSGRTLDFTGLSFAVGETKTLRLLLNVGAGVGDGKYTNQALAINAASGTAISNTASATVRIAPDPIFDCSDIIGKVFNDRNGNGIQEEGEEGLSEVTVTTVYGLLITTDEFGRYHVPCAAIPDAFLGSNFIMKLDESTLPFGFLMTSENPEIVRVTRGKLTKLNFGAAIYRLAKIELDDTAFDGNEPSAELAAAIRDLPETLSQAPTIVQFIHKGATRATKPRLRRLSNMMERAWDREGCCYPLKIETFVADSASAITELD